MHESPCWSFPRAMGSRAICGIHTWHFFWPAMRMRTVRLVKSSGRWSGSINEIARHDFGVFKELFDYDFDKMEADLDVKCFSISWKIIRMSMRTARFLTSGSATGSVDLGHALQRLRRMWMIFRRS